MTHYGNVRKSETHALLSRKEHAYSMWDAVTHVKDATSIEPMQKICTMCILISHTVTQYRNVTKGEVHFFISRKQLAYLMWDSVTYVKDVTICEPKN